MSSDLKFKLDEAVSAYNRPAFIADDPVCIPHRFSKKQDIEIMGFWAAILAWGQRKTIINKCTELITLMDGAPYDFVMNHKDTDLISLLNFKHRTFNATDTLYFIAFFKHHFSQSDSLETAFFPDVKNESIEQNLNLFRSYFFSLEDAPHRTRKHISSPQQKSTCKRLNMFLRWMIRRDNNGVDFGLWKSFSPSQLVSPLDLHVERTARKLGLIKRKQTDWQTAIELTDNLRKLDAADPVKYDFALFGLSIEGRLPHTRVADFSV